MPAHPGRRPINTVKPPNREAVRKAFCPSPKVQKIAGKARTGAIQPQPG